MVGKVWQVVPFLLPFQIRSSSHSPQLSILGPDNSPTPSIAPSASQSSELLMVGHTCELRALQVPPPPRKSLSRPLETGATLVRSS